MSHLSILIMLVLVTFMPFFEGAQSRIQGSRRRHNHPSLQSCPPNKPRRNKNMVMKAFQEFFGDHSVENIEAYVQDNLIQHNPNLPDGLEALKGYVSSMKDEPKVKVNILRSGADGDLVWLHNSFVEDNKTFVAVDIFRIHCGKIQEHWDLFQDTTLENGAANDHPFF